MRSGTRDLPRAAAGHLVTIASVAAIRGLPRYQTVYAATKAGLASLTEGIRADLWDTPINVSAIFPGYIESDISSGASKRMFLVDTATGCRALVHAIERERPKASCHRGRGRRSRSLMRTRRSGLLVKGM